MVTETLKIFILFNLTGIDPAYKLHTRDIVTPSFLYNVSPEVDLSYKTS